MDATTLLSCAGELSALLVSGGLLLAASVAAKQSRKRSREDDEHEPPAAREDGELSDGEEDSISVEWRQLRKLLKTNLQIDLVHRPDAGADDKYVRLNFATKLPAKPSADDENRLIKALSNAGIKVLGSEDAGVLCVSKSDVGFMSSEEVLRRLNIALSAYQVATAAAALAAAHAPVDAADDDDADADADEEESVVSSSGRRRRVVAPKKAPASAAKRRRTTGDQSAN